MGPPGVSLSALVRAQTLPTVEMGQELGAVKYAGRALELGLGPGLD